MPAKAVYLISPGYRRWITPDFTEIVFETEGFDPKEGKNWQARLIVTDLDGGAEATSTFPIDLSRKTFSLPVPKFHRRAEIILFLENPRDREPVCEGRWKLTNIPKDELAGLSYFDSRGVFFHEGVGRFPIVASMRQVQKSDLKRLADAGFTGVMLRPDMLDEGEAEIAQSLKMLLVPAGVTPDDVPRLRKFSAVAAYGTALSKEKQNTLRVVDYSRPSIAFSPLNSKGDDLDDSVGEYQDVIAFQPTASNSMMSPHSTPRRSGRQHFANIDVTNADFDSCLCLEVARGASGVLVRLPDTSDSVIASTSAKLNKVEQVVFAVVRGVPEPSDDSTDDRWFWRRRLPNGERAVIEVKRGDPPTATFKIERGEK